MLRIIAYVLEGLVYLLVLAITSPLLLFLGRAAPVRGEMVVSDDILDADLFADDAGVDVDLN